MSHARLSPSAAHRWMNCPGSISFAETLPREVREGTSEYAEEGTLAHKLAAQWLETGEQPDFAKEVEGADAAYEMYEGVKLYVDTVRSQLGTRQLLVEHRVHLGALDRDDLYGTADALALGDRVLDVWDLKYGKGVVVEVADNEQLMAYAVAAALTLLSPAPRPVNALERLDKVRLTIVQPRASHADGPVRSIEYTPHELTEFALAYLKAAERAESASLDDLHPGDWCRFCPALAHCPAQQRHAIEVAQHDFAAVPLEPPPAPETMPIEIVADIVGKVPVLETWIAALRRRVVSELEAGRDVPGWKLVAKRPRRVWLDADELAKWAEGAGLDPDVLEARSLVSPAHLEKIVGKKNLPEELYASVSSGATLAPESDRRPALAVGPGADFAALPPGVKDADIVEEQ